MTSLRPLASTTIGVLYEVRPLPRSAFHTCLPVSLFTASRYDAGA